MNCGRSADSNQSEIDNAAIQLCAPDSPDLAGETSVLLQVSILLLFSVLQILQSWRWNLSTATTDLCAPDHQDLVVGTTVLQLLFISKLQILQI
jgi:hypothetical protein